jgi:predicted DNA-binding transcriptional regulator AlpA
MKRKNKLGQVESSGPNPEKRMLRRAGIAEFLGVSTFLVDTWERDKLLPAPVIDNGPRRRYWSRDELLAWYAEGCPRREDWEQRKDGANPKGETDATD